MAIKKEIKEDEIIEETSLSTTKAKALFGTKGKGKNSENMILTTFSIAPSFKKDLEDLFGEMGLRWASGIRFALTEFYKKYSSGK
ncbi:MAG: hypothetical protein J5785_04430 [Spirochaetales bacterium]|nr:hypothetical protein [Spirochaetales bacterium]